MGCLQYILQGPLRLLVLTSFSLRILALSKTLLGMLAGIHSLACEHVIVLVLSSGMSCDDRLAIETCT